MQMWGLDMSKKQWTQQPGKFIVGPDDSGTWNMAGLDGGFVSASIYNQDHPSARILVHASASMTPDQARQFAKVLSDAADRAEGLQ